MAMVRALAYVSTFLPSNGHCVIWWFQFARVMQLLGRAVGESIDRYEDEYKRYVERVHEHWHPDLQSFCDFTVADGVS